MPTLPPATVPLLAPVAPRFSRRVWRHALVLLVGTLLAPGRRTVAAAVRAMGREHGKRFGRYHRVLSRDRWSGLAVGRTLLGLLVATCAPTGPRGVGIDETGARRRGAQIAAQGISRAPVRSRHRHCVKASGRRRVCPMLLVPIPWARRVWAPPFLTALAPSARDDRERGRRHKALTDRAGQPLLAVRRWWPARPGVAVAAATDAAREFLARWRSWPRPVPVVARLRLAAALDAPAPPRRPHQTGRPRLKGQRLPPLAATAAAPATAGAPATVADWSGRGPRAVASVAGAAVRSHPGLPPVPLRWVPLRDPDGASAPQALPCTDLVATPAQLLGRCVQRRQREVAFEAARRHRGVETQRRWSDRAIRRATPALLGLYSLVTLLARPHPATATGVRRAAWYPKLCPTFADALAGVRRHLRAHPAFRTSARGGDVGEGPRSVIDRLTEALCDAA